MSRVVEGAAGASWIAGVLPAGVERRPLTAHVDQRGAFTEVFRDEWQAMDRPVQWNLVRSEAGVFRGVHVHRRHSDYLLMAAGHMTLGVKDLREASVTYGAVALVTLRADDPSAMVIPPGVGHGFLFHEPSTHLYAVTHYWDPNDEHGCHWTDPELAIPWPQVGMPVKVSARDSALPGLRELLRTMRTWRS